MTLATVFISSTFQDLSDHRVELYDRLVEAGYGIERMEDFGSSGLTPLETCLDALERTDASVMLSGHRYGSLIPGYGVSYTEAEYEHAQALGHPIYVYLRSGFETGLEESDEPAPKKAQLQRLRTTMETEIVITRSEFETPDDVADQAVADLSRWTEAGNSRPQFASPLLDIEDSVAYAGRWVRRDNSQLLATRVVLVDLAAAHLPKTPPPRAGRLAAKLWSIKRDLEERGYTVFLFTSLKAVEAVDERRFDHRLAQLRASDALVVYFARDKHDLDRLAAFRGAGSAAFVWYRDEPPPDEFPVEMVEQWTTDELKSCTVAWDVRDAVDTYMGERILRLVGKRG